MVERQHQQDRADTFLAGQNRIFEKISEGAPLPEVLTSLVQLIESQSSGMLCSILIVDDDGLHLRHGAAPSLPESYVNVIDGMSIGPTAGSCGTAVYFAQPVIVTDIDKDPLWNDFRALAMMHGLRACWSTPIRSHSGRVSGAFAMYYRVARGPTPEEQSLTEVATHIASIAIESRRAAESLNRSEGRSRAILSAMPDSMFVLTSDFNYVDCHTRGFCQCLLPPEELIGKNMRDVLPPELADKFARCFEKVAESGELQLVEYELCVNGQMRYSEARVVPMEDGKLLALVRDITERKHAEQALRESEERFRFVALATRDGVYDRDIRTHTVWRNDAYRFLFSPAEPVEPKEEWWEKRIHPRDHERVIKSIEHTFQNQAQVWSAEYSLKRGDGTYAIVADRCYVLYDESGHPVRLIGALTDITERRLAEQALRNTEMEVRRSNGLIRKLAGKLMTAQEEERRRIARELHDDLNQKLAAISITISSIKNQLSGTDDYLKNQMEKLQISTVEIAAGIRRLSHELHPAVLEHVGLVAALKAYVAEFNRLENVQVGLKVPDLVGTIPQDVAVCLYRVAQESLRNIVKHSGVNYAEMTLSVDDYRVQLHVSDSGQGFDLTAARANGGLGLATMEERIRLVRGSFRISTQPGCGSKLMVTIPLRK